jgi:hypothetical protein
MAHVITPSVASGEHMSPPHQLATDKTILPEGNPACPSPGFVV